MAADDGGIFLAIILIALVVVAALSWGDMQEHQKMDAMISCVNTGIHSCPDYSEYGKEKCFNESVKRCHNLVYQKEV